LPVYGNPVIWDWGTTDNKGGQGADGKVWPSRSRSGLRFRPADNGRTPGFPCKIDDFTVFDARKARQVCARLAGDVLHSA